MLTATMFGQAGGLILVRYCLPVTADAHLDLRHSTASAFCLDDHVQAGGRRQVLLKCRSWVGGRMLAGSTFSPSEGVAGQED